MAHCVVFDGVSRSLSAPFVKAHVFYICSRWPLCRTQIHLIKKRINTDDSTFAVCRLLWLLAICSRSAHLQCGRAPSAPHIKNTLPRLAEKIVVWIIRGRRDKANESTVRWRCSRRHGGKKIIKNWYFLTRPSVFSPVPVPEINLLTVWNKPFRVYSPVCHGWRAKVDNGEQMGKPQHYYASGWTWPTGFRELAILFFWGVFFREQWYFLLSAQKRLLFLKTLRWIAPVAFSFYIGSHLSGCFKQYSERRGEKQ